MTEPAQPRRRHLMDPNAPRPVRDHAAENKSLSRVQRWVMSALVVTTLFHLVMGLIVAALFIDNPRPGAQVGLCLIAGAFGVIAVAVGFLIHGKKPLTPWLLVGLIPSAVGIYLVNR
jgi:lipopolysaccharide export LptBFGC system permease protein LptF